jgi:hypothetical protein
LCCLVLWICDITRYDNNRCTRILYYFHLYNIFFISQQSLMFGHQPLLQLDIDFLLLNCNPYSMVLPQNNPKVAKVYHPGRHALSHHTHKTPISINPQKAYEDLKTANQKKTPARGIIVIKISIAIVKKCMGIHPSYRKKEAGVGNKKDNIYNHFLPAATIFERKTGLVISFPGL